MTWEKNTKKQKQNETKSTIKVEWYPRYNFCSESNLIRRNHHFPWMMMTNIMMFWSLVAMATVQALVRCPRGCFSYNDNWEKFTSSPIHSGKKPFFADHAYIGLCNEPKMAGWRWLFAEKKIWKVEIYKIRQFWPIPSTSVLPAVQEKFTRYAIFLVHCIKCLLPFSLSPAKTRKVKNIEK